jgi:hypothetical protein
MGRLEYAKRVYSDLLGSPVISCKVVVCCTALSENAVVSECAPESSTLDIGLVLCLTTILED